MNPGRAKLVDVQPDGGHATYNPGEGATADNENTGATTEVVVVVPVTEPVTAVGEAKGPPATYKQ